MHSIYYFTGTGNSRQIAYDLQKELKDAVVKKITEYQGEMVESESIGIVFPVYDWGMPLILHEFLRKLSCKKMTYIYAITNFNGMPGLALSQCEEELRKRDRKLSAGFLIKMPGNYILWYGAKSKEEQEKRFALEKKKIVKIANIVKAKEEKRLETFLKSISRLVGPHMYKSVAGFHEEDRNFLVSDACTKCGLCEKTCPVHNIKMGENGPMWQHHCELCLGCLQRCPKEAINYKDKTEGKKRYINPTMSFHDAQE